MQFYMEKEGKACSEPLTLQTQKDEAKFVICLSENIHYLDNYLEDVPHCTSHGWDGMKQIQ